MTACEGLVMLLFSPDNTVFPTLTIAGSKAYSEQAVSMKAGRE